MRTPVTQAGWRIAIIARGGKMYSYSEIVSILLREFPEINEQYAKEIAWLKDTFQNQESEGQTSYFDHCFCDYIGHLFVDKQQDNLKIEKIFVFLENMATSRDSDVRNMLQVSVFDKGIITRHLKNGANLHQTAAIGENSKRRFLRDMAGVHWGPPCFGYQGGPQQNPAIPSAKYNYRVVTSRQKCPKEPGLGRLPNKHFCGPLPSKNFGVWPHPNCLPFVRSL